MLEFAGEPIPIPSYPLACFFTGFVLFVFVTWHIFRDRSTMYALERHLMFNPPYEIAFQGANLMLNRRKKDERPIRIVLIMLKQINILTQDISISSTNRYNSKYYFKTV